MEERIHKFYLNNRYIVLDIASGSVHVVEKIVYEMIDDYEKLSKDEIIEKYSKLYNEEDAKEAYEEIDYLAKEDLLFSEDEHFNLPRFNPQNVVKALCLHVAHDCNLRCKYCFASQGDFKGDRSLMTFETGKKADVLIYPFWVTYKMPSHDSHTSPFFVNSDTVPTFAPVE